MLVVPVLRHWKTPTIGVSFVLTAATEGLAVLGANLAVTYCAGWLVSVAAAALVLGLAFYIFTAARFDLRQLIIGHGDHWIAGGALAICALAAGHVTQAAAALGQLASLQPVLSTSTLVLWCLAMVWLLPLIICEILRPRLRYDTRRWATVFPLGIYAACQLRTPARSAASPGSPTSATPGPGSGSRLGCSRSPGCSIRACSCCAVSPARPLPTAKRGPRTLLRGTKDATHRVGASHSRA